MIYVAIVTKSLKRKEPITQVNNSTSNAQPARQYNIRQLEWKVTVCVCVCVCVCVSVGPKKEAG